MKRKCAVLLTAVLLLFALAVPAATEFKTFTRESVVVVQPGFSVTNGDFYRFGYGSGFFVGNQEEDPSYLVTNYHVIADYINFGSGELTTIEDVDGNLLEGRSIIRIYYDSLDCEEAYLIDSNQSKDIAVLKLADRTSKRKPLAFSIPSDSIVGSEIHAVGYPDLSDNDFSASTTTWGVKDSSVTSGTLGRILITQGTGVNVLQLDCILRHGNSGGPVVNADGNVLGIATWGYGDNTDAEMHYAVSISEVMPMLKLHSVEYTIADGDPSADDSADGNDTDGSGGSENTDITAAASESSKTVGLAPAVIIAIGIVLAAAIVVVVILLTRKKPAPVQPPAPQPDHVTAPSPKVPVVRSLAAQHGGMRVQVRGQILLGRSRGDCAIIYQDDTPGISSRHCSLSFDTASGVFILTDLNSTYGTFLQNGQKLTPGVPFRLNPGDGFYLGENANMLTVGLEG